MFVGIAIFLDSHTFLLPLYWQKPFGIGKVPSRQGVLPVREESDGGDGRVFAGADDDVTIRVWGANNVSSSNCIWSQNRGN